MTKLVLIVVTCAGITVCDRVDAAFVTVRVLLTLVVATIVDVAVHVRIMSFQYLQKSTLTSGSR